MKPSKMMGSRLMSNTVQPLKALAIVPAGAGSGKTYHIEKTLGEQVSAGLLAPEKIVAVTFTESAAAELRSRIRERLVEAELLEEALRLDRAYISTIHGFGLRLIREFAFDAGLSPLPRMLNDDEVKLLAGRALASSACAGMMMQNLERFGYVTKNPTGISSEELFRKRLLDFTATLRSIGKDVGALLLIPAAEQRIRELYGVVAEEVAEGGHAPLLAAVTALLAEFPYDVSKGGELKDSVRQKLWKDYADLTLAARGDALERDWTLWNRLAKLKVYKRKSPLPEGYDALASRVIAAAGLLERHPGPLQDALEHARALLGAAAESLELYAADKQKRGVVDFIDMLAVAHRLLDSNREVVEAFRKRVECLVIDEFQDTNPLQFSLLWSLTRQGVPALVVGDLKQAIMGFQNADARLLKELCRQNPEHTWPLNKNYRSSDELMEWINLVGKGLFADYTALEAKAGIKSLLTPAVEVFDAVVSMKKGPCASWTVSRLVELLQGVEGSGPQMVWDKQLGKHRPLRGGDIAIICYKNDRLLPYAEALRKAGLRCKLEEEGWLESREVQLAWYCLSYVADPADGYAALYLAVTELGSHTLHSALSAMTGGVALSEPLLEKLAVIAATTTERAVDGVLDALLVELDFYRTLAEWPNGVQARANLLRLEAECREFMMANREALACGGYYGSDIKTFQAWLKGKVERDKDGNKQPEAWVVDDDAVQLLTWHKSKGREWPVVAVCGMDDGEFPRLPATRVDYRDFSNLEEVLEQAQIELYPDFTSIQTKERFRVALLPESRDNAARLLYVALTRAREKVILEWPSYLESTKSGGEGTYWRELQSSSKIVLAEGGMSFDGGAVFPCRVSRSLVKETLEMVPKVCDYLLPLFGRRALVAAPLPIGLTAEAITPSSLHNVECRVPAGVREEGYGGELALDFAGIDDPMEKGKIIHRAFEVLTGHPGRSAMLADAVGFPLDVEQVRALSAAASSFDLWLEANYHPVMVETELPLLTLDGSGTMVSGFADMVLETEDGLWVVDHKSDYVPSEALREERFNCYYPQLNCYVEALKTARPLKAVLGIILNWTSYGRTSVLDVPL